MNNIQIILFLLLVSYFTGCGDYRKNNDNKLVTIIDYHNSYDRDGENISYSDVIITSYVPGGDNMITQERHEYLYDSVGNLRGLNKYELDDLYNSKILIESVVYDDLSETCVKMNGTDTAYYSKTLLDGPGGNMVAFRTKDASSYGNSDLEALYQYDSENRVISYSLENYLTGTRELRTYEYEIFDDTLKTHVYLNQTLSETKTKIEYPDRSVEHSFDINGQQLYTVETIKKGDNVIEVDYYFTSQGVDSIYYKNGKIIRDVHSYPDWHSVTTTEYDGKGNIIKEITTSTHKVNN